MRYDETELQSADAKQLFVRRYAAIDATGTETSPRTLMIVHGASEHGERYDHVARWFVKRGWSVVVLDLRGHGRSGGVPTHVRHFRQYVTDLQLVQEHFELAPERTAILGHSMGGLISVRFAQRHPDKLAAIVLMAPLLGIKVAIPRTTIAVGRIMSLVAPRTRFRSRIDPSDTTRNTEALAQRADDPLVERSVTARWFFAMRTALRTAWRDAHLIQTPLLVMQGQEDRIVDSDAVQPWLETLGTDDCSIQYLPDNLHELHNEPDWQSTMTHVVQWLDERVKVGEESAIAGQTPI
jgi:lysophospholipase